jgi:peptidoglycan/LPS O-acetylase OafA/YrhL
MLTIPSIGFLHDEACRRGTGSGTSRRGGPPIEVFGFTLIALCTACLLVSTFDASAGLLRLPPARIVCWLGKHSYELYLFHIIVLAGMRNLAPKGTLPYAYKLPYFALFLLLSGLVAAAVSRYFGEPLNTRLRRFLTRT